MNSRNDKTKKPVASESMVRNRRVEDAVAAEIEDVSLCRHCDCDMVYPIDWEQAEGTLWRVTLRCPNCEDVAPGVMDEELIEKFDCLLDRGTDSLVRDSAQPDLRQHGDRDQHVRRCARRGSHPARGLLVRRDGVKSFS